MIGAIVPAKGSGEKVRRAIQSLVAQTLRPNRVIVVVGSDCAARDAALSFGLRPANDMELVVDQRPHANLAAAWNIGLQQAAPVCEAVALLKGRDFYKPTKIEKSLAILGRHASVAAVVSDYDVLDQHGYPLRHYSRSFDMARLRANPQHDTNCVLRSSVLQGLTHGFDERLARSCSYELMLRIAQIGLIYHVADSLHVLDCRKEDQATMEANEQIRRSFANGK